MNEPLASRQPGTVYTFYSFKGGVGRSMALANVAALLARWGKRVLAIDFDLEAPGLEKYFADYIPADRGRRGVPGLIDLVTELRAGRKATWRDHLIRATVPDGTSIDLLTAGRDDLDYVSRLNAINWYELFEDHRFGDVLEDMRSEWIDAYDFVLIDSRTGFTDIGGICTIHLPDVLVAMFSANHQNLEGVRDVMNQARRSHHALPFERSPLLVLPVPARDETDNEYVLAGQWRTRFAAELTELFDDWAPQAQAIDKLLDRVKLPYIPYWSFGERLPVLHEEASNPKTLAGSFAFLARLVLHRLDWDEAVSGKGAAAAELAAIEARLRDARQAEIDARSEIAVPSPYPGLRPFSTDDAAVFFGRDAEVHDIVRQLDAGERELYVVGPSGCGKSSLIFAGVMPRLARGTSGSRPFVIRTMRPGDHPMQRLAEALDTDLADPVAGVQVALARVAEGTSLLLVIDQLEGVLAAASPTRIEFTAALRALFADPRCVLLGVVRTSAITTFLDRPFGTEVDRRSTRIEIRPMGREALRAAIIEPARARGVDFAPDLVERLLADAGLEPGSLPFVQTTLHELWQSRRGSRITLADYEVLGGADRSAIAAAISSRADVALRTLSADQQAIARRILLRLVSFGEGHANTRRQQPVKALRTAAEDVGEFNRVLDQLVASRVLIITAGDAPAEPGGDVGERCVDLAHESLIASWPTLADWIAELRTAEERRRLLETAARDWVRGGRSADRLLSAAALADIEASRTEVASLLGQSADLVELITASQAARERARRWQRRIRVGGIVLAATWVSFAVLLVLLRIQAQRASEKAEHALAQSYQEIGRQLLLDGRAPEALPYFVAVRQSGADSWPLRLLFGTAVDALPIVPPVEHAGFVYSAAFSPDGARVLTASEDRTAYLWDARTGQPIASFQHEGTVYSAAFSSDGKRVVTASADHTVRMWDSDSGRSVGPPLNHPGIVGSAAFSPDGKRVVTVSADAAARVWDIATGGLIARLPHAGPVNVAMFSPDGARVVTASGDRTAGLWNVATGAVIARLEHTDVVTAAMFSPDGARVVTASRDRTARVWEVATGKPMTGSLVHADAVNSAVFSPDGSRVATASDDHTAQVWDAATGRPVTPLLQHQNRVASIAFSSDGARVITASADRTARIWSADTGQALYAALVHPGAVGAAAFSPDGTRAVTASTDHTRIWDATPGVPRSLAIDHAGPATSAAFSPDGSRVVIARSDGTARIHDSATGASVVELRHGARVASIAFSPNGMRVATAGGDRMVRIWDSTTGAQLAALRCDGTVNDAEFSPGAGDRIVTASDDGTAQIWDAATGAQIAKLSRQASAVRSAAFSPDGKRVATASDDRNARIWDAATGSLLVTLRGHDAAVNAAVFSPRDGFRLVTASDDKTVRIWDVATGSQVIVLTEYDGAVRSAAFSADGACIVTASADRTVRMWDAATGKPLSFPLAHEQFVVSAAFSRDGARLVTAGAEVRIWTLSIDRGTLHDWSEAAQRSPFQLDGGVLVPRMPPSGKPPEIDPPLTPRDR